MPVLAYANYKEPFYCIPMRVPWGWGQCCCRNNPTGQKSSGIHQPILNKSERNYDAHKLEFLALKWAITEQFHEYLYGAAQFASLRTTTH